MVDMLTALTAGEALKIAGASQRGHWGHALNGILRRIRRRSWQGETSMRVLRFYILPYGTKERVSIELAKLGYVLSAGNIVSWSHV